MKVRTGLRSGIEVTDNLGDAGSSGESDLRQLSPRQALALANVLFALAMGLVLFHKVDNLAIALSSRVGDIGRGLAHGKR